jgi:long-chain acyl-CoA synthetase
LQRKQDYPRNCGSGGVWLVAETQQSCAHLAASTTDYHTMPKLLLRNAVKLADRAAMREKKLGIWQTYTWANVLEEVRAFSLGLRVLGLKRDNTIALLGDNRPRLYWTFAAAQALGAIPVPVYQDSVAEELIFVLSHAEVTMAVVENQEQVDKLLCAQSFTTTRGVS